MRIRVIYHGFKLVSKIVHDGEVVFQRSPVVFHVIEDGKLIILGALNANNLPDGLYLDCTSGWVYPVQDGNVLTIEQVYKATQNGNVLGVE